jgi:hypothetical protein
MSTQLSFDEPATLLDLVEALRLPAPIAGSVAAHSRHLVDLVASMRVIALPDEVVRRTVHVMLASYEEELVTALLGLKGGELRA